MVIDLFSQDSHLKKLMLIFKSFIFKTKLDKFVLFYEEEGELRYFLPGIIIDFSVYFKCSQCTLIHHLCVP